MIRVNNNSFNNNEKKYLLDCIESGWVSSEGPYVKKFEAGFAEKLGCKHALTVVNGTAALEVALAALGIGPGDEVIMPTFTIISCASAVIRVGAVPVLVDVDPVTWNMSPEETAKRISPRTKAIMAVHIYGLPCDMGKISKIAEEHNLFLIEDCAEILGQTYNGQACGTFGDISTFSFYANKHITTGEGGMLVCNDDKLAERIASLRNLCFEPGRRFIHHELGWNYRMCNLQAAVGLAQLEVLDETIRIKRSVGKKYYEAFKDSKYIELAPESMPFADSIYWVFGIVLKECLSIDAAEFIKLLAGSGIESRPFFWCMHEQPVFHKMGFFKGESFPLSERLARRGLYLPSGSAITNQQIDTVIKTVKNHLRE